MRKVIPACVLVILALLVILSDFNYNRFSLVGKSRLQKGSVLAASYGVNAITRRYWNGDPLHKVFVYDEQPEERARWYASGAVIKEINYGSFSLLLVNSTSIQQKYAKGLPQFAGTDSDDLLTLNGLVINTTRPQTELNQLPVSIRKRSMPDIIAGRVSPTEGQYIVKFVGPIKKEWLSEVTSTGAKTVAYVGQEAYVVRADAEATAGLSRLLAEKDYIQYLGDYEPAHKLRPGLRKLIEQAEQPLATENGTAAKDESVRVVVQVVNGDDSQATIEYLKSLSLEPAEVDSVMQYQNVSVKLKASQLGEIAAMDSVFAIEGKGTFVLHDAYQARLVTNTFEGTGNYQIWLKSKGFPLVPSATDPVTVNVVDDCPNLKTNRSSAGRSDFDERFAFTSNPAGRSEYQSGHGMINAHILGGGYYGIAPFTTGHASSGPDFTPGSGIAPFVKIGVTAIFDNNDEVYTDRVGEWENDAYERGARISSNSWGRSIDNYDDTYDIYAQKYDSLAFDVGYPHRCGISGSPCCDNDPATALPPCCDNYPSTSTPDCRQMLFIFSAGNNADADRDGVPEGSTISSPGTAKNVITVGANEGLQPVSTSSCETAEDANNNSDIAFFSGRGKSRRLTAENGPEQCEGPAGNRRLSDFVRFKPDLVAPGTRIYGTVPREDLYLDTLFGCDKYYPSDQKLYTWVSGTSHAAPAVSGAAALLKYRHPLFSPAMVKAWLLNSAEQLKGAGTIDRCTRRPDLTSNTQGMGQLNLARAFDNTPRFWNDQTHIVTTSSSEYLVSGTVAESGKPLRITLVWSDPPGATNTEQHLVNDLDLVVNAGGRVYIGNLFNGNESISRSGIGSGNKRDDKNNVESVYISNLNAGSQFTVRVVRKAIRGDGVGGSARGAGTPTLLLRQSFALLVYNANVAGSAPGISTGQRAVTVSAASYGSNRVAVAPDSIAALFAPNLASSNRQANTLPLPTELAGISVYIKDSNGTQHISPLFFVGQGQITYLVPQNAALGFAQVTVKKPDGTTSSETIEIVSYAPGIFTANSSGTGTAAALAYRVRNGLGNYEPVSRIESNGSISPVPIDLSPQSDQVYLLLYGTGIRGHGDLTQVRLQAGGRILPVQAAEAQASFAGLDQVNVLLPRSLIGLGNIKLQLFVKEKRSQEIEIFIK